jgi:hypothetical protein
VSASSAFSSSPPGAGRRIAGCSSSAVFLLRLRSLPQLSQTLLYHSHGLESGDRPWASPSPRASPAHASSPTSPRPLTPAFAHEHHRSIRAELLKSRPHRDLLQSASPAPSPSPPPVPFINVPPTFGSAGSSGSNVADELRPIMCLFYVLFSPRAFPAPPGARSAAQPVPAQPLPSVRYPNTSFSGAPPGRA